VLSAKLIKQRLQIEVGDQSRHLHELLENLSEQMLTECHLAELEELCVQQRLLSLLYFPSLDQWF